MRRLLLPALLLLGLALAACAQQAAETEPTEPEVIEVTREVTVEGETETITEVVTATPAEETEEAAGPKTMVICMAQEPTTLAWFENALVTSAVLEAVQEPLIDARSYEYQANLVEKLPSFEDGDMTIEEVTISEGDQFYNPLADETLTLTAGMTETFTLNQLEGEPETHEGYEGGELTTVQMSAQWTLTEGLMWEDGEPVTADDVVFAYEINQDPDWPGSRYTLDRTESVTAVDERTFQQVGLPGYTSGTFQVFNSYWYPQPRHVYGEMTVSEMLEDKVVNRDPLGYGAYLIDEWVAGESITLSPNPDYVKGQPPLDTLIYRFVPDTNQLISQLVSGQCDIGTQDAALEGSMPLVRSHEEQGLLAIQEVSGTVYEHLDFNITPVEGYEGPAATLLDNEGNRLFANPTFRQAIAHCIDRQAIADQATNGTAFVQHTYMSADHPLYPGDDALTILEHDPERGLEMLAELGYTPGEEGVLVNGQGQQLAFEHSTRRNPMREKVTQIVQQQLAENCSIKTEITLASSDYFSPGPDGMVFGRRYDLGEFAWLTGVQPPCDLYISSQLPSPEFGWNAANNTGFQNQTFDQACNAAIQTLDEEEKAEKHTEALQIFTEELPSIPLFARAKIAIHRPVVSGLEMDPTANSELWNVENFDINLQQ